MWGSRRSPPFDSDVLCFGGTNPGRNIGLVVDRRENDLGAGREVEGLGEV